jgi:type II secretory pathway pseudopilin PulG
MKNQKNERGITLVALVVTIVVLLILAGITIMYVMSDNGVFGRANQAKTETNKSVVEEAVLMAIGDLYGEIYAPTQKEDGSNKTLQEVFEADLPKDITVKTAGTFNTPTTAGELTITNYVLTYKDVDYNVSFSASGLTVSEVTTPGA